MPMRIFFLALLAILALPARSETTTVTVCGTDTAVSRVGDVNLATALAAGGDIVIDCGAGPFDIRMSGAYALRAATTIDGGGVTLIGSGKGAMFIPAGPLPLVLRNLT